MHDALLQRWAASAVQPDAGVIVDRVVSARLGPVLVCSTGGQRFELGFAAGAGRAWAWRLAWEDVAELRSALEERVPDLARPWTPPWRARDPYDHLDALRAWLRRPEPCAPEWFLLEGARLRAATVPAGDRRLVLDLEKTSASGGTQMLRFVAELFDRGANFHVLSADGDRLASWAQRQPAPARAENDRPPGKARPEAAAWWDTGAACVTVQPVPPAPDAARLPLRVAAWLDLAGMAARDLQRDLQRDTRRTVRRLRKLVEGLERDRERAREASRWRQLGELLTANLHRVRRGDQQIVVEDWNTPGALRTIELDPACTPQENAARFFKRAKRGERGLPTIEQRLLEAREQLEQAQATAAPSPPGEPGPPRPAAWVETLAAHPEALRGRLPSRPPPTLRKLWSPAGPDWRPAAPRRIQRREAREAGGPGRRYLLEGTWEVLVGRNNTENDLLTHRIARPGDLWFHASGVSGSHVILRLPGSAAGKMPPRRIVEQVAAIAARFSKAKHSGVVPVIYTFRRYVRKPRGAPPGLAACSRAKTVFVTPGAPESGSATDPNDA